MAPEDRTFCRSHRRTSTHTHTPRHMCIVARLLAIVYHTHEWNWLFNCHCSPSFVQLLHFAFCHDRRFCIYKYIFATIGNHRRFDECERITNSLTKKQKPNDAVTFICASFICIIISVCSLSRKIKHLRFLDILPIYFRPAALHLCSSRHSQHIHSCTI